MDIDEEAVATKCRRTTRTEIKHAKYEKIDTDGSGSTTNTLSDEEQWELLGMHWKKFLPLFDGTLGNPHRRYTLRNRTECKKTSSPKTILTHEQVFVKMNWNISAQSEYWKTL
jgi:hypothetical protein